MTDFYSSYLISFYMQRSFYYRITN